VRIAGVHWSGGTPFRLGKFEITPFLTDHSAFDAYMLLVEAGGRRILYSGDFRIHGRKSALVDRLMANPPRVGRWFDYYNNHRPHSTLAGRTPTEAYGQIDFSDQVGHAPPDLKTKLAA
jgi:transposase InsO family protein